MRRSRSQRRQRRKGLPWFRRSLEQSGRRSRRVGAIRLSHSFDSARQSSDTLLLAERALDDLISDLVAVTCCREESAQHLLLCHSSGTATALRKSTSTRFWDLPTLCCTKPGGDGEKLCLVCANPSGRF